MRLRIAVGSLTLALACLGLTACGGNSAASSGDFMKIGQTPFTAIAGTNPFVATISSPFLLTYPELVQYNAAEQIVPDFAKTWSHSNNGLTWTFHTYAGAKWSDGKPLTAYDVAWTANMLVKYQQGGAALEASFVVPDMKSAKALNNTTVSITYTRPTALVLTDLTSMWILPEHVWRKYATGTSGTALTHFANSAPYVSGGPFIFQKWTVNTSAIFVRNPNFWGPKPKLKGFGIQIYQDVDAMITALKSGQLDAVDYIPPEDLQTISAPGIHSASVPGGSTDFLAINSNPKRKEHPELLNPQVRQALDMAINREQIVNIVYGGHAQEGSTIVPAADGSWHDMAIKATPFNIKEANAILDKLGYKRGSNGIRIANGHPMSYTVVFPSYMQGPGTREMDIIQHGFSEIGVRVVPEDVTGAAATDATFGPNNKYLSMDMNLGNWLWSGDAYFMLQTFTCGAYGSWNVDGYCNKSFDAAYNAQLSILNPADRLQAIYRLEETSFHLYTQLALAYANWTSGWQKNWTGFTNTSGGWFATSNFGMLDIKKA